MEPDYASLLELDLLEAQSLFADEDLSCNPDAMKEEDEVCDGEEALLDRRIVDSFLLPSSSVSFPSMPAIGEMRMSEPPAARPVRFVPPSSSRFSFDPAIGTTSQTDDYAKLDQLYELLGVPSGFAPRSDNEKPQENTLAVQPTIAQHAPTSNSGMFKGLRCLSLTHSCGVGAPRRRATKKQFKKVNLGAFTTQCYLLC